MFVILLATGLVMPSLRRTFSSSSVRSSPYRYPPLSPSALSASANAETRQPPRRRSSGGSTSHRRVLADIDWWLVHDGQRDFSAEDEDTTADADPSETTEVEQDANAEAGNVAGQGRSALSAWHFDVGVHLGVHDGPFDPVPYRFNGTVSPSDRDSFEVRIPQVYKTNEQLC